MERREERGDVANLGEQVEGCGGLWWCMAKGGDGGRLLAMEFYLLTKLKLVL